MNHYQAIILALEALGGEGTIGDVNDWIQAEYPNTWKDPGTAMADMVPESLGGNRSSNVSEEYRVLERVSSGRYRLFASPIACKVNNVFIHVSDLKKSVKWYCDLLGLPFDEVQVKSPVHNIPVTSETGLTLDDHTFDPGFTLKPSEHVLFNFYVQDIDKAHRFVKNKGITIVKEIERIGDFAYFNFKDLDGNVLMVCNN